VRRQLDGAFHQLAAGRKGEMDFFNTIGQIRSWPQCAHLRHSSWRAEYLKAAVRCVPQQRLSDELCNAIA
jgi:hypothetical protein